VNIDTDERQLALGHLRLFLKAHHPCGGIEFRDAERPRVGDSGQPDLRIRLQCRAA